MSGNQLANFSMQLELNNIDTKIERLTLALSQIPDSDPNTADLLERVGIFHNHRFDLVGEPSEIDKAIEYTSTALKLTPNSHQSLSRRLANQAMYHSKRFKRLGAENDNDKAIEYASLALAATPEGHPALPTRIANLGGLHEQRFGLLGQLSDLDRAIEYESRAVVLTPDDHPYLSGLLQNLGLSFRVRFERLGELSDLERSIEHLTRAVALTPDGHPDLSAQLQNLGGSLQARFERLGKLGDLDNAIEHQSRAVALTPEGHPNLSMRLDNLGGSLRIRFEHVGELGNLDKAIEHQSRAAALTPDGHVSLSTRLYNLGVSHTHRFRYLHQKEDLQSAIDRISRSIELTPHGHPDLPHKHFPLAQCRLFQYQYRFASNSSKLQESLDSYRMASQSSSGSPRVRFKYALLWAKDTSHEAYLNPIEAYQTAISLLPQFIWLGATTAQRYEDLTSAESLAINAASAAILASDYALALEWLEHARCVVWNQSLMLRSPLDNLSSCDPDLATRIQSVAAELYLAGSESRRSQSTISGSPTPEQVAQHHRQLAQEYEKLISQARILPGFADFLRPIKAASLVRAARYGHIVLINCHEDRCDALIVMPGQDHVDHLPLPNFTAKTAQHIRKQMESSIIDNRQRERGAKLWWELEQKVGFESILANLWNHIVKPVLDFLGFTDNPSPTNPPHITWCPTGALSFLPLHAAGDYGEPGSRVFDYVISSYTPTLSAILPASPSLPTGAPRVLAIAQPDTPDHTRLPGTAEELKYLSDHASGKLECTQLIGNQATTTTVLDAMEQHDWVHLACHAHQNIQDSTKSGFFLHDGTLDLAAINRRSFKNKGLAFLSACQTATGDEKLPDEAIHLASGMLMAGYSSVIGTMWSVMDDDAPFVADKVYGQLMKNGNIRNGEAGKALHYAVAELRERVGDKKFGRWVPYIHIGS